MTARLPPSQQKRCTRCGETKPVEAFHKQSATRDGRTTRCAECLNASHRKRVRGLELTSDRLRQVLSANPETGEFLWVEGRRKGKKAGSPSNSGHIRIKIDGRTYLAHRLMWFWCFGEWPEGQIDHINQDPDDNRIANLRVATAQLNGYNRRLGRDNTSGVAGVYRGRGDKWCAHISVDKKLKHLGTFESLEEAASERKAAEAKYYREFAPQRVA